LTNFIHKPVLAKECIEGLNIKASGIYVDGTLGGGGHAAAILQKLDDNGLLIGIDRDAAAISAAKDKLVGNFRLVRDRHENIKEILKESPPIDGFLLDLGVSSHQLDTAERGFSYRYDAPLDMRMDEDSQLTAYDIVNSYPEKELSSIIKRYGEERYAKRIARAIRKMDKPVKTTFELAQIVRDAIPGYNPGHPEARTFQAIRIAVNNELTELSQTITDMTELLKPGGRICIISFHSLEDRIVKQAFKYWSDPCECPRNIPYCVCETKARLKLISKKPIRPSSQELNDNPRAHSAKLRIAERCI